MRPRTGSVGIHTLCVGVISCRLVILIVIEYLGVLVTRVVLTYTKGKAVQFDKIPVCAFINGGFKNIISIGYDIIRRDKHVPRPISVLAGLALWDT